MITKLTHTTGDLLAKYEGYMRRGLVHEDAILAAERFRYEYPEPILVEIYKRADGRFCTIIYEAKPKPWAAPVFRALNKIKSRINRNPQED